MKTYNVYGIGNALVDAEFEVTDEFLKHENIQKGLMTLVDGEAQRVLYDRLVVKFGLKKRAGGGSAANSMYAISQFGGSAFYTCKVASDEPGDYYVKQLGEHNIKTNLSQQREYGDTGKCLVMVSPDAERTMLTFLGISAEISSQDLNLEALKDSQYLYLEGYLAASPSGKQACVDARKAAEANGVAIAMSLSDAAMVQFCRGGLEEMVGDGVTLLFANETEAMAWTGKDTVDAAMEALKKISKTIVITLGSKGALMFDGKKLLTVDSIPVKAIDTNGAGDMFAGAFLYAITNGKDFATAGRLASYAASRTVSYFGPRLPAEAHPEILSKILM
ncbi:MAG: adenosine kinase [Pseudomonadota bacterium]